MTEITFNRKSFIETLDVFQSQFELASPAVVLETEPSGDRFILTAKRKDAPEVKAFGPCSVKGEPLNVEFDIQDLRRAVAEASTTGDDLTLLIGDGLWVKEAATEEDEA
jgi:hypothetical protein